MRYAFSLLVGLVLLPSAPARSREPSVEGTWRFPVALSGPTSLMRMRLANGRVLFSNLDLGKRRTYYDYYLTGTYTLRNGLLSVRYTKCRIDERRLSEEDRERVRAAPEREAAFAAKMLRIRFPTAQVRSVDGKQMVLGDPNGKGKTLVFRREK